MLSKFARCLFFEIIHKFITESRVIDFRPARKRRPGIAFSPIIASVFSTGSRRNRGRCEKRTNSDIRFWIRWGRKSSSWAIRPAEAPPRRGRREVPPAVSRTWRFLFDPISRLDAAPVVSRMRRFRFFRKGRLRGAPKVALGDFR